jgi:hypothetical protein
MPKHDYDAWLERDVQAQYSRSEWIEQAADDLMFTARDLDPTNIDAFMNAIFEHDALDDDAYRNGTQATLTSEALNAPGAERAFYEALGRSLWNAVFDCLHDRAIHEATLRYDYIQSIGSDNHE